MKIKRLVGVGSPVCGDQRVEAGVGRPTCGGWCRKADVWRRLVEAWSSERRGGAED